MSPMKANRILAAVVAVFLSVSAAAAQKTEITISLNEQFVDALLDAIYQNSPPPEFQLSRSSSAPADRMFSTSSSGFVQRSTINDQRSPGSHPGCGSVTLLRENR